MNVSFEKDGGSGVVAEGTYVWDAAKRLGVNLPAECGGRGECDTCAVVIVEGATLLSSLTNAERERLSPERLAVGERLACQTRIEHGGNLVLRPVPVTEREETTEETVSQFRKEFRDLPLDRKLATLAELEAVTAFQTLNAIANVPYLIGGKVLEIMAVFGRQKAARAREERRPGEHREHQTTAPPVTEEGAAANN
ncbi:MAG TPA: 2Fe-2S iron-sulfur cluster-binding protein [Pyrinomonadaceae bacterium]|nr:2Fe-2S iron-sulfur cluster-binding protein [Pyrinomonadaceae bacterium]